MSIVDAIRGVYPTAGLKGVGLLTLARAFHVTPEIAIRAPGLGYPVHLRIGVADLSVYQSIYLGGEYALANCNPKVIIDAGANIGMAALFFAREYPEARIFAIEPETANFKLLRKNVNHYPKIVPINAALWHKTDLVTLEPDANHRRSDAFRIGMSGQKVLTITLDSLLEQYKLESIDILKIDIEGAEKEVFAHCSQWIDRVGLIAVETHDRFCPGSSAAVDGATADFKTRTTRGETLFLSNRKSRSQEPG